MTDTAGSPHVALADGTRWPALGLGMWRYGETAPGSAAFAAEVAAIRRAIEIGWRLFDTAEMYAEGGSETVLGQALTDAVRAGDVRREDLLVVSKVYPHNAGGAALDRACEASLRRLQLDQVDLYLLHWRGSVPLRETVAGFERLREQGRLVRWGVSNFDVDDLQELAAVPGGQGGVANQVYHSLAERGVEFALAPWMREHGLIEMAYSPLGQGELAAGGAGAAALEAVARRHGATPAQVALAALLAQPGTMPIPKTANPQRLQENWDAQRLRLTVQDLRELDAAFPPPRRKQPLATT